MFEVYATNWPSADLRDPRNQFHEIALHEARVATEVRGDTVVAAVRDGFLARLRAAVAGRPAITEPCNCPA